MSTREEKVQFVSLLEAMGLSPQILQDAIDNRSFAIELVATMNRKACGSSGPVPFKTAREVMGSSYLGVVGTDAQPPRVVPFTLETLRQCRQSHILAYVGKCTPRDLSAGRILCATEESWFTTPIQASWVLLCKEPLRGSLGAAYKTQLQMAKQPKVAVAQLARVGAILCHRPNALPELRNFAVRCAEHTESEVPDISCPGGRCEILASYIHEMQPHVGLAVVRMPDFT